MTQGQSSHNEPQTSTGEATPVTKKVIFNSVAWNAVEKYFSQGISFLVSIIMARILTPAEYGIIGIIGVFIGFSNIFINSGLSRALTCKANCTKEDFCTANWVNIAISIVCYAVLFCCAPFIADFYEMPILTPTTRVMTLSFIIGAVSGVSRTILTKKLQFKKMSLVTLVTSVFSGIIGIILAYLGYGVWALVFQSVLSALFSSAYIMIMARFTPRLIFSMDSFKELFGFGSKILGSDIIWVIFNNIYPLIIGKGFNAQSVGYFTRANAYSQLVPTNFSSILENVLFPVFSNMQNDENRLTQLYARSLTVTSFFIFTGNFFLMGLSYPLIINMISEKWLPCVPLLQILCLSTLFNHINSINGRLLMAKGFPGSFLKMQAFTQPLAILIIFISFLFGIEGLAWGQVLISFSSIVINCYIFYKRTKLNPFYFLRKSFGILFISGLIGLGALLAFEHILQPSISNLIIVLAIMSVMQLITVRFFLPNVYHEIKSLLK